MVAGEGGSWPNQALQRTASASGRVQAQAKGHEAGAETDDFNLRLAKGNVNLTRRPGSDGRPCLGRHELHFSRFGRLFALAQCTGTN